MKVCFITQLQRIWKCHQTDERNIYVLFIKCILITIEPLQHVKQAHWLPCIISCFKFHISNRADVTEPRPEPVHNF